MANGRVSTSTRLMTSRLLPWPQPVPQYGQKRLSLDAPGRVWWSPCLELFCTRKKEKIRLRRSPRRGLQQLASRAWTTSTHVTGSYDTLTKTGAPCTVVLRSDAGDVWLVCNSRVFVFVSRPKSKPHRVAPPMALAAASHHAGVSHDSCSRRRRWNTHDAPRGLNTAGAQRGQKLGGAEFFNEACPLERTVKNILDVRRAQMEKLLTW